MDLDWGALRLSEPRFSYATRNEWVWPRNGDSGSIRMAESDGRYEIIENDQEPLESYWLDSLEEAAERLRMLGCRDWDALGLRTPVASNSRDLHWHDWADRDFNEVSLGPHEKGWQVHYASNDANATATFDVHKTLEKAADHLRRLGCGKEGK